MLSGSSFELSTGAQVSFSRPSIDVLFESMARTYAERSIGIILTGANHDGARGLQEIQKAGGFTIVQDPETAESQAMPLAAMASCSVDRLLRLDEIGPFLASLQPTKISRRPENYGSIGI
jgi:two-component system chemotaxis response regulator CheB